MRRWLAFIAGLVWTASALGQTPALNKGASPPTVGVGWMEVETSPSAGACLSAGPPLCACAPACCPASRFWGGAEYLVWWIKDGPLPGPLVTTGDPLDLAPGALGQPGTRVLFGDRLDYGTFSGVRLTLGGWLDADNIWGFEASGFLLERRSTGFSASSDAAGNPALFVPVFRTDLGREGSFTIANPNALPGVITGNIAIASHTRLWGAEANGYANLFSSGRLTADLLAGFRYLDLAEDLGLFANVNDAFLDIQTSAAESFNTRNQFYGGQVGARIDYTTGRLSLDLIGKLALGGNHETVNIAGTSVQSGTGALAPGVVFPGGILTQATNIGRQSHDQFAVVGQLGVQASWKIASQIRAVIGYDVLYLNQAVRPGAQIDRNINVTGALGGTLVGPATPAPQFNRTDFFAHGLSFGVEFRY